MSWRVDFTEYERGWGSRPDGFKLFETEEAALEFQRAFNAKNDKPVAPDWYMIAETPRKVK